MVLSVAEAIVLAAEAVALAAETTMTATETTVQLEKWGTVSKVPGNYKKKLFE